MRLVTRKYLKASYFEILLDFFKNKNFFNSFV